MRFQNTDIEDPKAEDRQARDKHAVALTAALVAVGGIMVLKMGLIVTLVQNVSMALAVTA